MDVIFKKAVTSYTLLALSVWITKCMYCYINLTLKIKLRIKGSNLALYTKVNNVSVHLQYTIINVIYSINQSFRISFNSC